VNTLIPSKTFPIYIALGTNLGDRAQNLRKAVQMMPPQVNIVDKSPVYQTPPWGYEDQPKFLNQVIFAYTTLPPKDLLTYLKNIEIQIGRTPSFRYGPRLVDLDILFYGNLILKSKELQIPHPRIAERAFVLVPLNDLKPDLEHPLLKVSVNKLLQQLDKTGIEPFTAS
jgi:2-amino-4-hydroxy-6-hydroxymethyldihydropteridine diphosphokinase